MDMCMLVHAPITAANQTEGPKIAYRSKKELANERVAAAQLAKRLAAEELISAQKAIDAFKELE